MLYLDIRTVEVTQRAERAGNVLGAERHPDGLEVSRRDGHFRAAIFVQMRLEDVVAELHGLLGVERRLEARQAQGDGRVPGPGVAQEFRALALVPAHEPLAQRRVEQHVRVVRALHDEAAQQSHPLHELLPRERLRAEQRVHRVVHLEQAHRVQAGQAHAQDGLHALERALAREAQVEVQQVHLGQADGQDFERGRLGDEVAALDQVERQLGVQVVAAGQAAQMGGEAGRLRAGTVARAVDLRRGADALHARHGDAAADRGVAAHAVPDVVDHVPVDPLVRRRGIESGEGNEFFIELVQLFGLESIGRRRDLIDHASIK